VRHHVRDEDNSYSVEGRHEAIINQEQFDIAQKILANNKKVTPRKAPRESNYFAGFLTCVLCGYKMLTHNIHNTLKDGTQSVTGDYRCPNKTMRVCTASSVSHKKLERAFEEYIFQVPDLDVADEIQLQIEARKKQETETQIKAYQEKQRQLEAKEREAMTLYVANEMEFESYREIKKMVDKEKAIIKIELERLQAADNVELVDKSDIVNNFRENWSELSASERRHFLLQFMDKITLVNEKLPDAHYGTVKILDMDFLPKHEKQRAEQQKNHNISR